MRLLADESCDFATVRALRAAGHDVLAAAEASPRADDRQVVELAVRERRVLVTEDKDFGRLVYAHGARAHGVILLRYPQSARHHIAEVVVDLVEKHADRLTECFVVVRPGRTRIARRPPSGS